MSQTMTERRIPCAHCGKRFVDELARWSHTKAKHKGAPNPCPAEIDDGESFADRAAQAEIDRACGVHNDDDWLLQ